MSEANMDLADSSDMFKILLATDNHVGYMEKDGVRYRDSVNTLEEILSIAQREEVDFLLLGGDLFHENCPSTYTMHSCVRLIRQYCFGDRPVQFQRAAASADGDPGDCGGVNFEDANLNVSVPVFIVHGNHDDPLGREGLSALDVLDSAGLVNLFGKHDNVETVELSPILMAKGSTRLALYGLGNIRDERLHDLFVQQAVTVLSPEEDQDSCSTSWWCTSKHGQTNYLPESFINPIIDLVMWGHEHECRIVPERNAQTGVFITQPGSSVATSLCPGEAVQKQVGLLYIKGRDFRIEPIPLDSVRPFVFDTLCLAERRVPVTSSSEDLQALVAAQVELLIERAESQRRPKAPELPLVRLRIDYTGGYETFSGQKFAQRFVGRVANPRDLLLFCK
uniref:Mre11_DNA_bind domain-containing protein n=1 Tax=Macrostomum lignano TaxID=282301 RepID=A0A1I8I8N5_9PLAT